VAPLPRTPQACQDRGQGRRLPQRGWPERGRARAGQPRRLGGEAQIGATDLGVGVGHPFTSVVQIRRGVHRVEQQAVAQDRLKERPDRNAL